jgi:hypothetical protein
LPPFLRTRPGLCCCRLSGGSPGVKLRVTSIVLTQELGHVIGSKPPRARPGRGNERKLDPLLFTVRGLCVAQLLLQSPVRYQRLASRCLTVVYGLLAATRRVAPHGPKAYQKRTPGDRRSLIVSPQASSSRAYTPVCRMSGENCGLIPSDGSFL